jgi:hypothetical protein
VRRADTSGVIETGSIAISPEANAAGETAENDGSCTAGFRLALISSARTPRMKSWSYRAEAFVTSGVALAVAPSTFVRRYSLRML